MKIKEKIHSKLLAIANKKINKAIENDVGNGVDFEIEELHTHIGTDGTIKVYFAASAETTIGSFMSIYRQVEES